MVLGLRRNLQTPWHRNLWGQVKDSSAKKGSRESSSPKGWLPRHHHHPLPFPSSASEVFRTIPGCPRQKREAPHSRRGGAPRHRPPGSEKGPSRLLLRVWLCFKITRFRKSTAGAQPAGLPGGPRGPGPGSRARAGRRLRQAVPPRELSARRPPPGSRLPSAPPHTLTLVHTAHSLTLLDLVPPKPDPRPAPGPRTRSGGGGGGGRSGTQTRRDELAPGPSPSRPGSPGPGDSPPVCPRPRPAGVSATAAGAPRSQPHWRTRGGGRVEPPPSYLRVESRPRAAAPRSLPAGPRGSRRRRRGPRVRRELAGASPAAGAAPQGEEETKQRRASSPTHSFTHSLSHNRSPARPLHNSYPPPNGGSGDGGDTEAGARRNGPPNPPPPSSPRPAPSLQPAQLRPLRLLLPPPGHTSPPAPLRARPPHTQIPGGRGEAVQPAPRGAQLRLTTVSVRTPAPLLRSLSDTWTCRCVEPLTPLSRSLLKFPHPSRAPTSPPRRRKLPTYPFPPAPPETPQAGAPARPCSRDCGASGPSHGQSHLATPLPTGRTAPPSHVPKPPSPPSHAFHWQSGPLCPPCLRSCGAWSVHLPRSTAAARTPTLPLHPCLLRVATPRMPPPPLLSSLPSPSLGMDPDPGSLTVMGWGEGAKHPSLPSPSLPPPLQEWSARSARHSSFLPLPPDRVTSSPAPLAPPIPRNYNRLNCPAARPLEFAFGFRRLRRAGAGAQPPPEASERARAGQDTEGGERARAGLRPPCPPPTHTLHVLPRGPSSLAGAERRLQWALRTVSRVSHRRAHVLVAFSDPKKKALRAAVRGSEMESFV
ncbi:basic proline-rich protein-like [Vombatus ursinus]|uniref:basic proline-rich protein-like n=1 Tax=Vombatus ursinus TaxID=29139 RepID=UPI000FFD1EFC|nr:basic proline-rich protein-like [Vombatus ursinus]